MYRRLEMLKKGDDKVLLDKEGIKKVIPHREPMLLVDKVIDFRCGEFIVAEKLVTDKDCQGHFPGEPIFPGVFVIESLAQTCAILGLWGSDSERQHVLFRGIEKVKFRNSARPGDILTLEAKKLKSKRGLWTFEVKASCQEKIVVQTEISATML